MSSVLLGIAVALFTWLFLRQVRARVAQRRRARHAEAAGTQKTMPRVGTPGTVTKEQIQRLKALHFHPSRDWSAAEAELVLDTVAYLRAVITQLQGNGDASEEVQNRILAFILSDDELRAYLLAWGRDRRDKDDGAAPISLEQSEQFERIAAFARSSLSASS